MAAACLGDFAENRRVFGGPFAPGLHNRCEGAAYIGEKVFIGEAHAAGGWGDDQKGRRLSGGIARFAIMPTFGRMSSSAIIAWSAIPPRSRIPCSLIMPRPRISIMWAIPSWLQSPYGGGGEDFQFHFVRRNGLGGDRWQAVQHRVAKVWRALGDGCEIGCNAVLSPGSIIGRGSVVYPNVSWRGVLAGHMIVKNKAAQEIVARRREAGPKAAR